MSSSAYARAYPPRSSRRRIFFNHRDDPFRGPHIRAGESSDTRDGERRRTSFRRKRSWPPSGPGEGEKHVQGQSSHAGRFFGRQAWTRLSPTSAFLISQLQRFCPWRAPKVPSIRAPLGPAGVMLTASRLSCVATRSQFSASFRMRYCCEFPLDGSVPVMR